MLIAEIPLSIVNQIFIDNYKKINGVFLIKKPVGITSHDVVDDVRKILRTRQVGHAGTLDPFASGLLIILVGKFTKYSDAFMNLDKSYLAEICLGISSLTQDPEGPILDKVDYIESGYKLDIFDLNLQINNLLSKFAPSYMQLVPLFSSVKIDGNKLRVLARKASNIIRISKEKYKLEFNNNESILLELPKKLVNINGIDIKSITPIEFFQLLNLETVKGNFLNMNIEVACSKGTYIRQLAEDIGDIFNLPAALQNLSRIKIGEFTIENSISISDLVEISRSKGLFLEASLEKLKAKLD